MTWFLAIDPVDGSTTAPARIATAFWAIPGTANSSIRKRESLFTSVLPKWLSLELAPFVQQTTFYWRDESRLGTSSFADSVKNSAAKRRDLNL
jgi:hypothetical protein